MTTHRVSHIFSAGEELELIRALDRQAELKAAHSEYNSLAAKLKAKLAGIVYVQLGRHTVTGGLVSYAAHPGFAAGQSWRFVVVSKEIKCTTTKKTK
jgi:hypothetical protein